MRIHRAIEAWKLWFAAFGQGKGKKLHCIILCNIHLSWRYISSPLRIVSHFKNNKMKSKLDIFYLNIFLKLIFKMVF